MRQLQPVIWSKGTFLSPQHLQAQERFVEDCARFYLDSLNSRSLGIPLTSSSTPRPSPRACSPSPAPPASSPTRSPSTSPPPTPRPPPASSTSASTTGRESCMFYLAIPQYLQGGMNVSIAARPRQHSLPRPDADGARREQRHQREARPGRAQEPADPRRRRKPRRLRRSSAAPRIAQRPAAGIYSPRPHLHPTPDRHPRPPHPQPHPQRHGRAAGRPQQPALRQPAARKTSPSPTSPPPTSPTSGCSTPSTPTFRPAPLPRFQQRPARAALQRAVRPRRRPHRFLHQDRAARPAPPTTTSTRRLLRRARPPHPRPCSKPSSPATSSPSRSSSCRDTIYATSIDKDAYFEGSRFYLAISADIRDADLIDRAPKLAEDPAPPPRSKRSFATPCPASACSTSPPRPAPSPSS